MYPLSIKEFQNELAQHRGLKPGEFPLQLYTPYFCNDSQYFDHSRQSNPSWKHVESNTSIDGCGHYHFLNAHPDESRAFYDWYFAKGEAVGMVSFEPDFMNQNYNCVPDFIHSATNAITWQHGMADAALAKNLTVQWCYAAPTDVLASLEMPAVTNYRVSNDFCYGHSWNIGMSSLIVWAAGVAPSKDTLWSTDNNKFPIPGCGWTNDHEEPAAELHVLLALMSTGPVGLSDGIHMSNGALLRKTIRSDGTLLKPSKPITAIDSEIAILASADQADQDPGHVYTTFSGQLTPALPVVPTGVVGAPSTSFEFKQWKVLAYYFVSFMLPKQAAIAPLDFYPSITATNKLAVRVTGTGGSAQGLCANGSDAKDCVDFVTAPTDPHSASALLMAPASNFANVTGGTHYAPALTTVWPETCPSSLWVLGDLTKFVAMSSERFTDVKCSATGGVAMAVHGRGGETVPVTAIKGSRVMVVNVTIPASGVYQLVIN
jgi:hypothetical protein